MFKSIIVGVDATPQAAGAVKAAAAIARSDGSSLRVVHAVEQAWVAPSGTAARRDASEFNATLLANAREQVVAFLKEQVSSDVADSLEVLPGRGAAVLHDLVHQTDPDLVVLGGKHHGAVARWLGGSTALHALRAHDVPVLVVTHPTEKIEKVLVAVDLSEASAPTIDAAARLAQSTGAELHALHVVEHLAPMEVPLPYTPEDSKKWANEVLEKDIWPRLPAGAHHDVAYGDTVIEIERAVDRIKADVLVVGSHGMGWFDRILIGSTTERLVNDMKVSTLVVPIADR